MYDDSKILPRNRRSVTFFFFFFSFAIMSFVHGWVWFYFVIAFLIFLICGFSTLISVYFYYTCRHLPSLRSRHAKSAILQVLSLYFYSLGRVATFGRYFWSRYLLETPVWFQLLDLTFYAIPLRTFFVATIFRVYSKK